MGYPVKLEHKKYLRNTLCYNIGLIFSPETENLDIYKNIVRKLGETFKALESESEYLFNTEKKKYLLPKLRNVMTDLNTSHRCYIPVGDCNAIRLRVFPVIPNSLNINGSHVVIPIENENVTKVIIFIFVGILPPFSCSFA